MRESIIIHTGPYPSKLPYALSSSIYILYPNKCMKHGRFTIRGTTILRTSFFQKKKNNITYYVKKHSTKIAFFFQLLTWRVLVANVIQIRPHPPYNIFSLPYIYICTHTSTIHPKKASKTERNVQVMCLISTFINHLMWLPWFFIYTAKKWESNSFTKKKSENPISQFHP